MQKAMLVLLGLGLAGTCFLISAGAGLEEGHQPWKPSSLLRHITTLMNFNAEIPTTTGVEVKWLVQGLTASVGLVVVAGAFWRRTRRDSDADFTDDADEAQDDSKPIPWRDRLSRLSLVTAAQLAMGAFVVWMLLSSLWSRYPEGSLADGMIRLTAVIWAISLARTLRHRACRQAVIVMVAVLTAMAVLGVWYHYERAPLQRLKFPIGNPIFLAAMLLPGLLSACAGALALLFSARGRTAASANERDRTAPWTRWGGLGAFVLAIGAIIWALLLSNSRGPIVGLAVGVVVTILIVAPRKLRIGIWFATLLMIAGIWTTKTWPVTWLESRPTTVRFRMYAWSYARDLFLSSETMPDGKTFGRTDVGHGQGTYMLLAQSMSRDDALLDPPAFPGGLVGHAHNEWLQVMAELGAIGFALLATSLGLTLYAAIAALRRYRARSEPWWRTVGLSAALIALMVEEIFNVGLRMPGLPLVFHTVLGLLWASSTPPETEDRADESVAMPLRLGLLAICLAGTAGLLIASVANWQSARAEYELVRAVESRKWDQVDSLANETLGFRWSMEDRMESLDRVVVAHHATAAHHRDRLFTMLQRHAAGEAIDPDRLRQLAVQDYEQASFHSLREMELIQRIVQAMPLYPDVAGLAAESCLMHQDLRETLANLQVFERPDRSFVQEAYRWLEMELASNRYDAMVALTLVRLAPGSPTLTQLDWLRIPLRVRMSGSDYEQIIRLLARKPDFNEAIHALLTTTVGNASATQPASPSQDAFGPESLRLSSVALSVVGHPAQSADHAARAAEQYRPLLERFPYAVAYARLEQARYAFLATPDDPSAALDACRLAIDESGDLSENTRALVHRAAALYEVARADEDRARSHLREIGVASEQLDVELAQSYVELAMLGMEVETEAIPESVGRQLERAMELASRWPAPWQVAFDLAVRRNDMSQAERLLEQVQERIQDPRVWESWVRSLLGRYADHAGLRALFNLPATQPAESDEARPSTAPSFSEPPLPENLSNDGAILPELPSSTTQPSSGDLFVPFKTDVPNSR